MRNSINLIPPVKHEEVKKENKHLKYDIITFIVVAVFVFAGVAVILTDVVINSMISNYNNKISIATDELTKYKPLLADYEIINDKVNQINTIKTARTNPSDVLNYLTTIVPNATTLSNFTYDTSTRKFQVNISNTDYLNIAKFLFTIEKSNLKVRNVELNSISFSSSGLTSTITGVYNAK